MFALRIAAKKVQKELKLTDREIENYLRAYNTFPLDQFKHITPQSLVQYYEAIGVQFSGPESCELIKKFASKDVDYIDIDIFVRSLSQHSQNVHSLNFRLLILTLLIYYF